MQIQELAKKLEQLGLADKEARVYVASLFLGPSPVQKIAEQASVNRATTYVILDQLADFGLVSQSNEGKKTVFIAEEPQALDKLFDIQLRQIEDRKQELKNILPQLKRSQRAQDESAPSVRFYKGTESIVNVISNSLKKAQSNSTIYGFSNLQESAKIIPRKSIPYIDRRVKKAIKSRVIYYDPDTNFKSDRKLLRETKEFSKPILADITLLEDRAIFTNYDEKNSVSVVIDNKSIVGALRQLFDLSWNNDKLD